jgi:hypothetical protein
MNRDRMIASQCGQLRMGQTARAHVILGMDLEERDWMRVLTDGGEMFGFEADTGTGR